MKPKLIIFLERGIPFLKEIAESIASHTKLVRNASDATLALVLNQHPVKKIERLLAEYPKLKVLTTMTPHDFRDPRVFFLNSRCRDLDVNCFANYLWDIQNLVTHIDMKMGYGPSINLRTEAMEALSVIDLLTGFNMADLNVRFSFNDNGLHMSCYERGSNFTASCFITRVSEATFFEEISVFTSDGGRFTLDSGEMGNHTYAERFGAAWQTIVDETEGGNRNHQKNIKQLVLKVKGASIRTAPTTGRHRSPHHRG